MDLLTVDETARMLKINPITVRRYIADGRLPAVRVGRRVRVRREALEEFLAPVAPSPSPEECERALFEPPSAEEIARRQALLAVILARSESRRISPLTTADLVHKTRERERRLHEVR